MHAALLISVGRGEPGVCKLLAGLKPGLYKMVSGLARRAWPFDSLRLNKPRHYKTDKKPKKTD